jgi:hypothetical protein
MKNKYDSAMVFLYAIARENLLPHEFRKKFLLQQLQLGERPIMVVI